MSVAGGVILVDRRKGLVHRFEVCLESLDQLVSSPV